MNTIKEAALRAYGADKAVKDAEAAEQKAKQDQAAIEHLTHVLQEWGITVHVDSPEVIIDGVKISGERTYRNENILAVQWLCSECGADRIGWGWQYIGSLAELGKMWVEQKAVLCNDCQNKRYKQEADTQQEQSINDANVNLARALATFLRIHGAYPEYDDREDYDEQPY